MAFVTANVKSNYFGSLNVTTGDWSGSIGDAAGTISVKGGRVYLANFVSQDSTTPQAVEFQISNSQSNAICTLTVNNIETVTNGRFIIISA